MYQSRVTSNPRSVEATIFSTEESPPLITRFMGASPFACELGRRTRIHQVLGNTAVDKQHLLARHALAIKRRALLQRVIHVIADADVLREKLLPHAVVEAGSLVLECGSGKVVKHEPDQIQD